MQKIKFIADTACDIPDEEMETYNIALPSVPITIDGKGYFERRSFSIREFYGVLAATKEIPATSRVPIADYLLLYQQAWEQGYTHVISVTINASGSGTYASARMAMEQFYDEHPGAEGAMAIHLVDSRTYSVGYGYPVIQAAQMARQGTPVGEILDYLQDFFDRLEIYLGCYTLEYAKKSGRISAASAFVGDVLGLRPIIYLIDGATKIVEKVRGEKQVAQRLLDAYKTRCDVPDGPVLVISAAEDRYGNELCALLKKELRREILHYKAGASIVINAGPKIAAVCFLGKKRSHPTEGGQR